ncbi:DUF2850 domain-containing protein [Vibrio mytili]|uniref:DUF2850 domain-containing protein n=1 Tax=Vibrio mytili TaxID=50718 RepID=UPI003C6FA2EE
MISSSLGAKKTTLRKWVERSLMLLAVIGTVVVCMLYSDLFTRYVTPTNSNSMIYGKWVEQNVAPYAREVIVLSERGVSVNDSLVATSFKFDGDSFSYRVGDAERHFDFVDHENYTEMKLNANAHYLPVFHLQERSTKAIR